MRCAVKKTAGRAKLIFGTGANNTQKAVDATVLAERLGADGILAVTPYYNKCTQNGLYEYYRAICAATSLPVICYNVPSRTGVNILPETMERIAQIENIAGIKEASGNMAQVLDTARRIRGKCDLYSGEDPLNLPILCAGGTAVISVVSNPARGSFRSDDNTAPTASHVSGNAAFSRRASQRFSLKRTIAASRRAKRNSASRRKGSKAARCLSPFRRASGNSR